MRATEQIIPTMKDVNGQDPSRFLSAMLESENRALQSVERALPIIANAAEAITLYLKNGSGRLIYAGAGCSGLVACQDNMELWQTFSWPENRSLVLLAGGDAARLCNSAPNEDDPAAAIDAVRDANVSAEDVVVAVTASGSTPWTVALAQEVAIRGALVVAIANNPEAPLFSHAAHSICLESGSEVVAGSTRLSATTAQKVTINMLSTLVMARMGYVMNGMMINFIANNDKLRERAQHTVMTIAKCDTREAKSSLTAVDGNVRLAILVALGLSPSQANDALVVAAGDLRAALETSKP